MRKHFAHASMIDAVCGFLVSAPYCLLRWGVSITSEFSRWAWLEDERIFLQLFLAWPDAVYIYTVTFSTKDSC